MARPKKDPSELIERTLSVGLSQADYSAWLAKVQASGLTKSAFFRQAVLANQTQVLARPKASPDRRRLLYQVNQAGNNLNQLAHRANADHQAGKLGESTYGEILRNLEMISLYLKATLNHVD